MHRNGLEEFEVCGILMEHLMNSKAQFEILDLLKVIRASERLHVPISLVEILIEFISHKDPIIQLESLRTLSMYASIYEEEIIKFGGLTQLVNFL
jgi:hypothetical protein